MIAFQAVVTDIYERKFRKHEGGAGPAARFSSGSMGWYIQLDGMISVFVGTARPDFKIDDQILITMEKTGG